MINQLLDEYYIDEKRFLELFDSTMTGSSIIDGKIEKTSIELHLSFLFYLVVIGNITDFKHLDKIETLQFLKNHANELGPLINDKRTKEKELLSLVANKWTNNHDQ